MKQIKCAQQIRSQHGLAEIDVVVHLGLELPFAPQFANVQVRHDNLNIRVLFSIVDYCLGLGFFSENITL